MVSNSLSILEDLYLSENFHLGACASQFESESSNFVSNGLIRESTFTDEKREKVFSATKGSLTHCAFYMFDFVAMPTCLLCRLCQSCGKTDKKALDDQ